VKTLAHILQYVHGMPVRKTPAILEDMTGARLTQSAITQDAMKQSKGAKAFEAFASVLQTIRKMHRPAALLPVLLSCSARPD
jgi:hypothetical protein